MIKALNDTEPASLLNQRADKAGPEADHFDSLARYILPGADEFWACPVLRPDNIQAEARYRLAAGPLAFMAVKDRHTMTIRASEIPTMPDAPLLIPAPFDAPSASASRSLCSERILVQQNAAPASAPRTPEAPLIYAVDDQSDLTELYTTFLEAIGYRVKAFNDRVEALSALQADWRKPALLITDYRGLSMPVDPFLRRCLAAHPTLRILMASGFDHTEARIFHGRPGWFIRKPFTPDELQREVRAALIAC